MIARAVGPAKGKVTITAEAADGSGKKASCSFEVDMKANTSMTMPTDFEINGVGSSDKRYNSYKKYTDTNLVFRSSNTHVATVDTKGKIKIQQNPTSNEVTIYATTIDGQHTIELTIHVSSSGKYSK